MIAVIKKAWHYSRTIFVNAATMLLAIAQEAITYAVGADWASVTSNPKILFTILMVLNLANIVLRFLTTKPVGEK
jgi:hypothetical protein